MDIEQTIRDYIPQIIHLSLATVQDNKPWVCELHFAYDGDLNLYYRSLSSCRHSQEIGSNPHVAGNIVKQYALGEHSGMGVYFEGTAKLLEAGDEQDKAVEAIKARFQVGDEILDDARRPDGHKFYKITVDTFYVFGKFDDASFKKYELKWNGGTK